MTAHAGLRLGTRGSPLALVQARWVREALLARDPDAVVVVVAVRTTGDRRSEGRLAPVGGKGLFLKELEDALLAGEIDFAVHSMKDVPAVLPEGCTLAGVPQRADPRDVLIGSAGAGLAGLARGARVGTASTRRRALLLGHRRDLDVVVLRGNVQTRLGRWRAGDVDALVLAAAGLERLGMTDLDAVALPPEEILPAVGQGALALEYRADDLLMHDRLAAITDPEATAAVAAERGFLRAIGGDCDTPLAALAEVEGERVRLRALVSDPDGRRRLEACEAAPRAEADALGRRTADDLLRRGAAELLRS